MAIYLNDQSYSFLLKYILSKNSTGSKEGRTDYLRSSIRDCDTAL